MVRIIACLLAAGPILGCAHVQQSSDALDHCFVESGWLDSSNGCSIRAGYPDCYLVCPKAGTRVRVEDAQP
jgi:hypothetical protein